MTKQTLIPLCCLLVALSVGIPALAQSPAPLSPAVVHRVEDQIRARYDLPPTVDVTISAPKPGNYPGYDTIVVTLSHDGKTNTFDFLISQDRKTLARLETIDISRDLTSEINTAGRPVRGNVKAPVIVTVFMDYECPFSARWHNTLFPNLMREYGNRVKVIYVDYPLVDTHPWAMHAAIDANCLAAQNSTAYWDFVDYIYENRKLVAGATPAAGVDNLSKAAMEQAARHKLNAAALNACIQKNDEGPVRASMAMGDKVGVDSTPTTFINGLKVSGAQSEEQMRSLLDRAIAQSAVTPK